MIEASYGMLYGAAGGTSVRDSHLLRISRSGDYELLFQMANAAVDGQCTCFAHSGERRYLVWDR